VHHSLNAQIIINKKIKVDLATYNHSFSLKNKIGRLAWNIISHVLFRPFGSLLFKKWRVFVLKCFGAKLEWSSHVYSSVKIWAPWNLEMGSNSTLGPQVDCYNQGKIKIGSNTVISQKTYLCASSHDYNQTDFPLILKPIRIGNGVWIAAAAFIGPSVSVGNHSIVAARGVVIKDVEENAIVGGNPAIFIKSRIVK
jgi:putative colanic acid biosynthesis acetyltransferase WcaF